LPNLSSIAVKTGELGTFPKFWVSMSMYRKTLRDRVEISYNDYPESTKHAY
jgi:hypothetical protein